jgi:hypothetical protein
MLGFRFTAMRDIFDKNLRFLPGVRELVTALFREIYFAKVI